MYCKHCGQLIDNDSSFCKHCGKSQDSPVDSNSKDTTEDNKTGIPSIKVEIVKPEIISEETARKGTMTLLKELGILALLVGVAFIIKFGVFYVLNSQSYPIISEEDQEAFNEAYDKALYPNGYPSWEDISSGNVDWNKYHPRAVVETGYIEYRYLKIGEFKYDHECPTSMLSDINSFRKSALYRHAEKDSNTVFWIFLIALPLLRYVYLLYKWLTKSKYEDDE